MSSTLITILDAENQPLPPLPVEEVQRRLQAGELRVDQLAHVEGLSQWTPLHAVLAFVGSSVLATTANTPPPLLAAPIAPPSVVYAGFWLRFVALILDTIVFGIAIYLGMAVLLLISEPVAFIHSFGTNPDRIMDDAPFWVRAITDLYILTFFFLYYGLMQSSVKQATLGKMAVGIIVTDLQGQRISFLHAVGRTAATIISSLTCCAFYIGYLMAGFTDRKQALHDMIAGTLVVRK